MRKILLGGAFALALATSGPALAGLIAPALDPADMVGGDNRQGICRSCWTISSIAIWPSDMSALRKPDEGHRTYTLYIENRTAPPPPLVVAEAHPMTDVPLPLVIVVSLSSAVPVPEPASLALLCSGLAALWLARRRQSASRSQPASLSPRSSLHEASPYIGRFSRLAGCRWTV